MAAERTVIAVYRGTRLEDMRLFAVSSDRQLVADVAERLLELDERATRPGRRASATLQAPQIK
jgi:hypothetical protein